MRLYGQHDSDHTGCQGGDLAKAAEDRDFVQSLERGLSVVLAFSERTPKLTLGQIAQLTDLSRPAARRILLTLQKLGYVRTEGNHYALTPRVLAFGQAYLSSLNLTDVAQPRMEHLAGITRESSSIATLDNTEMVYVARVPTKRIMSITLTVGTRLPAHPTSMGRVLLAHLNPTELDEYFANAELIPLTRHTIIDETRLRNTLNATRSQGWALVDQELEEGLRSIAAPIRDATNQVIAALNVSTHVSRVDRTTIRESFLPALLDTASHISRDLGASAPD